MQATCPQCSHKLVIDDAKVPDRPFSVKCPKCQTVLKLPGKAAAAPPPPEPPEPPEEAPAEPPPPPPARDEPPGGGGHGPRALVALPDRSQAAAAKAPLARLAYAVDTLDDSDEGGRLIEQGIYDVVVAARVAAAAGKGESLYQRICRFSPDARRRIFLILVGDEFKSGDGTQAFAVLGDLVLHSRDVPKADNLIRNTLSERTRLYQVYLDARQRHEAAAG